jgi:adenine-specific DNA-methyltransferase
MRFIGGKARLLSELDAVVTRNAADAKSFCDLFAGTGSVARYFKPRYQIYANDFLHFSYVIQKGTVENNRVPAFEKLKAAGITDPLGYLETYDIDDPEHAPANTFIADNYAADEKTGGRMYFTLKNAKRIDFVRAAIEEWKDAGLTGEGEYYYLLASLIEGIPFVSNITGTYGAYLKEWDKRALNDFKMARLDVTGNGLNNRAFNRDANELIRELEGDILYVDPPYNSRQYASNYHLLETVSRNDQPPLRGVTGMRGYDGPRSVYSVKKKALPAFEDLLAHARFKHIVVSYSAAGLMSAGQIEEALKRYGNAGSYKRYDVPYRRYKSKIHYDEKVSGEYIFYIRKDIRRAGVFAMPGMEKAEAPAEQTLLDGYDSLDGVNTPEIFSAFSNPSAKPFRRPRYIKSPLNYVGGKFRQLPDILSRFPKNIGTFVDLFAGGCNVGINAQAGKIICNDINTKIIELFETFKAMDGDEIISRIEQRIAEYNLTKENESGYLAFRKMYNARPDPLDLYVLSCYSFNYQFRFNSALEYNNPFGRNRSRFSDRLKDSLLAFLKRIKEINIEFTSKDFIDFDFVALAPGDMVYCDPPYLITTGSYNDGNRGFKDWRENQELGLLMLLDALNERGVSFALSNVLTHKGTENKLLLNWCGKYNAVAVKSDYSNSSYNARRGESDGVLIMNY